MSDEPEFRAWDKIHRLNRDIVITEKIDGTNGLVHVSDDDQTVRAGSRSRWITPDSDNHGFARWVTENADELRGLGPGYHYGEWWGVGIQRRYGLDHKRFSLFNVHRWTDDDMRPRCCHVVPLLYRGPFDRSSPIERHIEFLRESGSVAAPGFMRPEGVVVFHVPSGHLFKVTLEGDLDGYGKDGVAA